MFRRVRDLIGRKEQEESEEIRPEEIPDILSSREKIWRDDFDVSAADSRKKIVDSRDRLVQIIQDLSRSEREAAFHPKLERIAKNSIPQFEKAMITSLNRQLPDEPDAFYQVCTEYLKGCVKALAGPGRYLRNVLPEEMKEIGVLVDGLGSEINVLTPIMADWRRKNSEAASLRETMRQTKDLENTLDGLCRDIPALGAQITDLNRAISRLNCGKEECERALAGDAAYQEGMREVSRFEIELSEAERDVHSLLSTLIHVMRKAEKIAHRPDTARLAKEMKRAISRLEGPQAEDLGTSIAAVLPILTGMIGTGEIQLKNQEERALFMDPAGIPGILEGRIRQRDEVLQKVTELKGRLDTHPALLSLERAEVDLAEMDSGVTEKERRLLEMKQKKDGIIGEIPSYYARMEDQISGIIGKKMRIRAQWNDNQHRGCDDG